MLIDVVHLGLEALVPIGAEEVDVSFLDGNDLGRVLGFC